MWQKVTQASVLRKADLAEGEGKETKIITLEKNI